ncbi:hypothetical protein D3C74_300570 [compost metagenome]
MRQAYLIGQKLSAPKLSRPNLIRAQIRVQTQEPIRVQTRAQIRERTALQAPAAAAPDKSREAALML